MSSEFSSVINFIRNMYNKPEGYIPLHEPKFTGNEKKYVTDCIDSTFVSSVGNYVGQFEKSVEEYTKTKKAVACVNGTSALHLALKLVGVQTGDEVITQPLTFIATVNAIAYCGADPVFVDIDNETLGLSAEKLDHFLKNNTITRKNGSIVHLLNKLTNKRISAIVPMHTFGNPCYIEDIVQVAGNYGIPVIEDAAESLGSFYKKKHTGIFGDIGVLSFNGNKTITTGGGGMLMIQNEQLGNHAKHLSTQAKLSHPWEFIHDHVGYNYRMPNINAALGLAQMEQLDTFLLKKSEVAEQYKLFFQDTSIEYIQANENCKPNHWLNSILLKDLKERNEFLNETNQAGVMTRPAWKLMNKLDMFSNCMCANIDNSKRIESKLVSIPSSVIDE